MNLTHHGHKTIEQLCAKLLFCILCIGFFSADLYANEAKIKRWILNEFQPSTLNLEEQTRELNWFAEAAKPYQDLTIHVISERIDTHWYEANTLSRAFYDITGIKVVHELTGEDDVIKKLSTQMEMGLNLYDGYINDSDLIGTHYRYDQVVALSDYMADQGRRVTLPSLDLDDFIGLKFSSGPDGKLYQLPDQQFANLYWYRHDWFSDSALKAKFYELYGYELNVPENWSAYEDIAEFFTEHVKEINGVRIYGHMDYGLKDPSIGWRFSDAWLSMAGAGDKGLPNGLPVDEWGIRVEDCHPVGASVERGGAANSPAAIYAMRKYQEWLKKYAPPEARNMNFTQAGAIPGNGTIAQQIFWYTAFTPALTDPKLSPAVVNADGTPKWRMAPSPRGVYWEKGMKLGYQDAGAWTFFKNTPPDRLAAAWLYAQFVVSKTVSLKKTIVGLTPVRKSDIHSDAFTQKSKSLGGLVEFYQSPARELWTPTGTNVPNYPALSPAWWQSIPEALSNLTTPEETMNALANRLDNALEKLSHNKELKCAPRLNPKKAQSYWLNQPGAPKPKLKLEKNQGRTLTYEQSLRQYSN